MAEILARRSALAGTCKPGRFGTPAARPGIVLSEIAGLTLLDLRGDPATAAFVASAQAVFGCALPLAPNTSVHGPLCDILWLGPDEWLCVAPEPGSIHDGLAVQSGSLTDVSHGRIVLSIGGPRARDLLAKSISLDLHPRAFGAGWCAQTALAHVGVLLHLPQAGREFTLYCARSYALHLWHWLTEAAAEFGYEVA